MEIVRLSDKNIFLHIYFSIFCLPSFPSFLFCFFVLLFFRSEAATRRKQLSSRAASCPSSRGHQISLRCSHKNTKYAAIKSFTNDQKGLKCRYYDSHKSYKVDGKGCSSHKPTLKTVPSEQKSNHRTCAKGCNRSFNTSY